ncbi:putative bifunctional polynucleotide phosphatase kinase protein [Phaeoacremonium minimum UCRPA7]|uniref:Putative bifunctional polynucleotide phosphatase kinase protein n=1 Tax=Phaeoacremonium minimum (strain UCR-PA7) TaxID=1286976 RepID=R8B8P8_PHAM7|nr:putative bifunctional polynucleotide phosphatase kinase protein [Phaeoacremonium minimum UCRPA7]EON95684.1 putative bifunctional polynucleotide phosphatase kinase protein [Phaeoacremonium minimum UCRPA7]
MLTHNPSLENAVASFFTPTSQKPKDRVVWSERAPDNDTPATLLVARYEPDAAKETQGTEDTSATKRRRIAAFDLDSTLITSASGKKHADSPTDWKWWDMSVPAKLRSLYHTDGYRIVILSNQGGITLHPDRNAKGPKKSIQDRLSSFKQKVSAVLSQLDIPLTLYAATGKDGFRKPRTGMWKEVCEDYGLTQEDVDTSKSIFVGDAGGRKAQLKGATAVPKDFSCSDRNFATNVGITYQTPEEFFMGEKPRDFTRDFDLTHYPFTASSLTETNTPLFEKKNDKDIVLFCGSPGAGKSTFYWKYLKPLGYERVNQDILKRYVLLIYRVVNITQKFYSKDKCFRAAADHLSEGDSVAIDNTNADPDTRAQWIELARKNKVPIRCLWFKTPIPIAEHNDAVRAMNRPMNPESRTSLPKLAFNGFASRFKEPKAKEGFQDVVEIDFKFRGTEDEYQIWGRYWL